MIRSANDRTEDAVKALDFLDELLVGDFCVGLERNESRVYVLAGIVPFSVDLQILDSYAPVLAIAKDVVKGILIRVVDYAADWLRALDVDLSLYELGPEDRDLAEDRAVL